MKSGDSLENYEINLLDPESCILDSNKGEKLIIELNNHICLGEYELARTFFKQILEVQPTYIRYFYNIIFIRGIPDKWLLSNQLRTSAHYIWILNQDYKNELSFNTNCPVITFNPQFLASNEFDLLITTAFYNSYENLENFEMNLEFLKDLRHIYNFFACISSKKNFLLPKLRILSPDKNKKGIYLCIDEGFYENIEGTLFDFSKQKYFMSNLKNLILTQPILSKQIIDKILLNTNENLEKREDFARIQEIFQIIYVDLIMLFIHFKDYQKVYEYLKFIPFNSSISICKSYVQLLFSVIAMLIHSNEIKNSQDVLIFTAFCANKLNIDHKNNNISNFRKLTFFSGQLSEYTKYIETDTLKDHERFLLKHKIYDSLLANKNEELLSNLHVLEDLYIVFQTENNEKIPVFFLNYRKNLKKKNNFFQDLTYDELMNLILSYSKFNFVNNSKEFLWKKAITNSFWNDYLNFLRVYQEHCLGYVLRQSITYVETGKFDNAVMLLHPLNNLKLLLILFVWDKFENDIDSRKVILDLFWNSYLSCKDSDFENQNYTLVPYFEDIIINLDYIINFSKWIQEKIKKYDSNKLYDDLLVHSIPLVMKNYLIDFEFKEILNYFVRRFPLSNRKLQKNHFHSTMIIFSFFFYHLILKKIEDHFSNSSENYDNPLFTENEKFEMIGILNKIILFPYRLNIMGEIFNLIFIKIKYFLDLREKDNIIENNTNQTTHSQFLYHKKIFLEIVKFLKNVIKPLENFNYNNLNSIFEEEYLDKGISNMIRSVKDKEIFLEDLKNIDTDYLAALKKQSNLTYKDFLIIKCDHLKFNVDELIFRFNIVDNSWLEIIYENNENNSFLSTILQNSTHYFQVAKKFQMWEIAETIIKFFKLPNSNKNEIHLMKYFTQLKNNLNLWVEDSNFTVEGLIDFSFLNKLIQKDFCNKFSKKEEYSEDIPKEDLYFEYFKILFDLSLTENISTYKSTVLMDKAISYLENSKEKGNSIFHHTIDRYKVFIDPNLSKDQKGECLSQMVVSTKNLGAVDITSLKNHLKILTNQQQALQNLIEKVNQPKAIELSHEDLNKYFVEAFQTIIDSEEYYYKTMDSDQITSKTHNQTNYLKIFLNYLINIGDIYYQARLNYMKKGTNYLKLLKKYPKEIIAKLFLKYNSESEALKIAKMTKTDLISVILEFTNYHKTSTVQYTEFNSYFHEILNVIENLNNLDNNTTINFDSLCEKEELVKGSEKTFPLSMRILEFVYKISYDKTENVEEYNQFVPLFVSLYRIEFDSLSDKEQIKFWTLLIDKYKNLKIFNNYIKMIFRKFYFYKTFYQKNQEFKHLYDKICNESNTNNSNNINLKEKFEMYKKLHTKVTSKNELNSMLPKTFNYIPMTNDYISKLQIKTGKYLESKMEKQNHEYSKYFKESNEYDKNLNVKFTDIQNLSYKKNINFYENLCQGLLNQKQYDLALDIADNYLDDTKSDVIQNLINEIVTNTNNEEKLFMLLLRMKDKNKVFEYTLINWYHWNPETTITILRLIEDDFTCGNKKKQIKNMIKKLKVFSSIIKRNILAHMTLKKLEMDCIQNVEKILEELMQKNSHDLCYKLLRVYNKFDQYKNTVKFSEIKLLLSTNDIQNKIMALEKLGEVNENKISFCTQLINGLNNYQNKLLIINYLLKNYPNELENEHHSSLVNKKIAIKVFFLIPNELQEQLVHLIDYPELIIETLLINMRFDIIIEIFYYFPKLQNDELITLYAEKAMSFYADKSEDMHYNNNLVILTTTNQKEIRKYHYFKTAPDFELFIKFMNICKNINIIAKVCFEVSNNCSKYLLEKNPSQPKLLFINFISKVLNYLESRLIQTDISEHEYDIILKIKQKLDIYEKLIGLFKEFIYQGIDDLVDLELEKFYQEDQYKEIVRDKLIDNDYINLAFKYCNELNIDSKRIDFKLGLFSLKNRNFLAARKGFEKILTSNNLRRGYFLNEKIKTSLSPQEHDDIISQIIAILQGSFNLKIDELEKIHRYLIFRLSCCIIPNEESTLKVLDRYRDLSLRKLQTKRKNINEENLYRTNLIQMNTNSNNSIKLNKYMDIILLDEYLKNEKNVILSETLYYIKAYGTTNQLLNFYIDNDLLDDTVNYVINNRISLEVFKEEVVKKCFEKKRMMYSLCLSLKKVYTTNKYAKDLIEEVINFLKTEEAHEELIEVYMLMTDFLKASLEAINIIKKTTDVDIKMQYYQKAALNLGEYLNGNTQGIIHIYDSSTDTSAGRGTKKVERNTLEAILKLLKLQIQVLSTKKDIPYTLITDDEEDRYKIVKEIITLDDNLSLAIIKEYNLKVSDVFMRSTIEAISNKNFTKFENLMQIIKKWNQNGIINMFSENFNELWDNILLQAISLIHLDDENSIIYAKENIIPRFNNDESRMYSLYLIGELENSVILAFQLKNVELINEIKSKAEKDNNRVLLELINNLNNS